MTPKQRFLFELDPLLIEAEQAITRRDIPKARAASMAMLILIRDYEPLIPPAEMKDALNNPVANRIAKSLGIKP